MLSLAMTKKKYESLSPEARAILDKYMGAPFSRYWAEKLTERISNIKTKIMNDPKHTIYKPNDNEMKQWKAVMNPVITSWNNEHEGWEKLLTGYKDGLKKARSIEK
jgi:TRAP-type C4-dicarboxylate transport system substrate-binding protein